MDNESLNDVTEQNIRHTNEVWEIDPADSALILVDFWSTHILQSHLDRYSEITDRLVAPLLPCARAAGITVVHAPGFTIAKRYPQWEAYADDEDRRETASTPEEQSPWPPPEFRNREGNYQAYARPFFDQELQKVGRRCYEERMILDSVSPQSEDYVVASGRQLHRLLTDRKILHLFYAGFSTDGCVQEKDYGTKVMAKRGYNIILIRDCTTGKENAYSNATMSATEMAINQIELYNVSTTSAELIAALRAST